MDATSSLTRRKPPAEALRGSTTLRLAVGSSKAELPLPRAVHRLSLLLNVIRRLGWLLITKGLPSALLLLRDALRAVLELVGALGARRAQFFSPARPPLCGIAPSRMIAPPPLIPCISGAQARTTARCASTSAGTASTSSRAARRAACGARRSTRSRRSTPSRRRRPPPTWRTEPAHARAGGASARRSRVAHLVVRVAHGQAMMMIEQHVILGCLAYVSSVCVCGAWCNVAACQPRNEVKMDAIPLPNRTSRSRSRRGPTAAGCSWWRRAAWRAAPGRGRARPPPPRARECRRAAGGRRRGTPWRRPP